MEALLSAMANLEFSAFEADEIPEDLAAYGLDDPVLTFRAAIAARTDGESTSVDTGELRVGAPAEDDSQQRYATHSARPELFRIPQALVDEVGEALRGVVDK